MDARPQSTCRTRCRIISGIAMLTLSFSVAATPVPVEPGVPLYPELFYLVKLYDETIRVLSEAKAQNDKLDDLKQVFKKSVSTYHSIRDFDPSYYGKLIERDVKGLTGLHGLKDSSFDQKLALIELELDRRITHAESTQERERYRYMKTRFKYHREMYEVEKSIAENKAKLKDNDLPMSESSKITAQSTTTIADMMRKDLQRVEEENLKAMEANATRLEFIGSLEQAVRQNGSPTHLKPNKTSMEAN